MNATAKSSSAAGSATQEVAVRELFLEGDKKEVSYEEIFDFVRRFAGGNEANVEIVPIEDNVDLKSDKPVPFGYGGQPGGVRETIQNWMIHGVDGDRSLKTVLNRAAKHGHSRRKPVCLYALMNGGYSPSSKYWGTPYVKLVVKPRPVSEDSAEQTQEAEQPKGKSSSKKGGKSGGSATKH